LERRDLLSLSIFRTVCQGCPDVCFRSIPPFPFRCRRRGLSSRFRARPLARPAATALRSSDL